MMHLPWLLLSILGFHLTRARFLSIFRRVLHLMGVQDDRAFRVYVVFMFPGVLLHESSHWITARILGVQTGKFSLRPQHNPRGVSRLGYVEIGASDPIRASIIGLAPLVMGLLLISVISEVGFGVSEGLNLLVSQGWPTLLKWIGAKFSDPLVWVLLYLILVISNSMLPSEADRGAWLRVFIFFLLLSLILVGLNLTSAILGWLTPIVIALSIELTAVFTIAMTVNGVGWGFLAITFGGLRLLRGYR